MDRSRNRPNRISSSAASRRVMSWWFKTDEFAAFYVILTTSAGERYIRYELQSGTDVKSGSYLVYYIGAGWSSGGRAGGARTALPTLSLGAAN